MLLLWSRKRVMSVLIYVFEGRMGFLFYFPSAKIDAFPQAECREHLALEISLPKLFFFFFPHSSCWMFRSNELVFSINVPVLSACACPQSALSWPGGVCWCQGQEPHGAQCPLHEALALLGPPHPPAWGALMFLIPLRWCWQGHFGEGFMQGLAGISAPKWFRDSPWMTITWGKKIWYFARAAW